MLATGLASDQTGEMDDHGVKHWVSRTQLVELIRICLRWDDYAAFALGWATWHGPTSSACPLTPRFP